MGFDAACRGGVENSACWLPTGAARLPLLLGGVHAGRREGRRPTARTVTTHTLGGMRLQAEAWEAKEKCEACTGGVEGRGTGLLRAVDGDAGG